MNIFTYPALTEECILRSSGVLPSGEYNFEVMDAIIGTSKTSGVPMVTLILMVKDNLEIMIEVRDYLMGEGKMLYKLKHFWESVNCYDMLMNGNAKREDFVKKKGKLKLTSIIDPIYGAKNKVDDYIPCDSKEFIEDEKLPF